MWAFIVLENVANLIREKKLLSPVLLYQNGWNNYISWKTWELLILLSDTEWIHSFWLLKILLQSHTKLNFSWILWWTINMAHFLGFGRKTVSWTTQWTENNRNDMLDDSSKIESETYLRRLHFWIKVWMS